MREIKCRGYDLDTKKWYYGGYVKFNKVTLCIATEKDVIENEEHLILFQGFSDWNLSAPRHMVDVDPKSVGQYTGLKDKNGKEIYEGDIVNATNGVIQGVVIYQAPEFVIKRKPTHKTWSQFILSSTENQYQEVIGNIYENPKLIL